MQLKGSNKSGSGTTKTKRDLQFKLRVIQLKENEGKSAKEALEQACQETGLPCTKGMLDHPHSFLNMYKVSISKSLEKGNAAVEAAVKAAGLAKDEPVAAPVAEVEETEDVQAEDQAYLDQDLSEGDDEDAE